MRNRNLASIKRYQPGDYLAVCDVCGFTFYASQLSLTYRNTRACERCFEVRNPQEFLVRQPSGIRPPWTRPKALVDDNAGVIPYQFAGLGMFLEIGGTQGFNIPGFGIFTGVD